MENKKFVPLTKRVCTDKSTKQCRRKETCKCVHLDGASVCHHMMYNLLYRLFIMIGLISAKQCDETCEGFAHTYEEWDAANSELEKKLDRWNRDAKYIKFWEDVKVANAENNLLNELIINAEQEELERMMMNEELKDYPEVLPLEMSPEEEEFCEQQVEEIDMFKQMMVHHQAYPNDFVYAGYDLMF